MEDILQDWLGNREFAQQTLSQLPGSQGSSNPGRQSNPGQSNPGGQSQPGGGPSHPRRQSQPEGQNLSGGGGSGQRSPEGTLGGGPVRPPSTEGAMRSNSLWDSTAVRPVSSEGGSFSRRSMPGEVTRQSSLRPSGGAAGGHRRSLDSPASAAWATQREACMSITAFLDTEEVRRRRGDVYVCVGDEVCVCGGDGGMGATSSSTRASQHSWRRMWCGVRDWGRGWGRVRGPGSSLAPG